MAIEVPFYHFEDCVFALQDNVASSASARGLVINRTRVFDRTWTLRAKTRPLDRVQRAKWSAWRNDLGGLNDFLAYDVTLSAPLAYPAALTAADVGAGWDGTATVTSVGLSGLLGVAGLPASYRAMPGDRVGLEQGGYYGYYEVLDEGIAVAGALTLRVAPLLHGVFTTAATARLWRPKCKFALAGKSWTEAGPVSPSPISFEAEQVL